MKKFLKPETRNLIVFLFFALSIMPILIMAFFARPLWDDFNSGVWMHQFISEKNYLKAFISPFGAAVGMYVSWQGTYFAEVLFAMQPGAWPIPAYWFTTFLIVGSVSFSYIFLGKTVSERIFKSNKAYGSIIALLGLTLQYQKVPYIHQGFYWFNGAVYYSFFLALLLFELALIIRVLYSETASASKRIKGLAVLAFLISGGNYSTALVNCMILFLMLLYAYFALDKDRFKAVRLIFIVAMAGLVISMVAPGNAVRASQSNTMSPPVAIYSAIRYALKTLKNWSTFWMLAMILLMIPVVYYMVKDSGVKFRYPVIALVILFGLYAAQVAPPYYGLSSPGDKRQIDMYYYTFYLLIITSLIYVEGWAISRFPKIKELLGKCAPFFAAIGILIIVGGIAVKGVKNFNSYKIADDLVSGRAAQYVTEYSQITQKMEAEDGICYVQDISQWTNSLDKLDIQPDPEYWVNVSLAEYFGCEQVILQ